MINDLKPYSDNKESGLPWLGKVPRHWVIKRGKSYLTSVDERSKSGKEELLTVSSARGVIPRQSATVTMFKAKSYIGYKLCWPGDLVINSLWAWGGGLGVSQYHGIISTAYSVYRTRKSADVLPRYLHELVRSAAFNWELHIRSKGIWISRLQLTDTAFLDAPMPLPPPDEQAAIVRFLDYANGKIERAIRAKRKLIGLLNEQKQAIIHRAVTRGLDPSVKLKPSGIPWLGDVPEHWEVRRLSSVADFASGKAHEQFVDPSGLHICVTARFVSTDGLAQKKCTHNFSPAKKGDVLMVMSDLPQGRALARAFLVEDDKSYAVNQRVCILRPRKIIPAYLAFQANRNWGLLQHDDRYNQTHLSNRDYKTLPLLCPPISEQERIVFYLKKSVDQIPNLIARNDNEIEFLREYLATLTANVVTGKLDVREAAKRLPEQLDKLLPSDDSIDEENNNEISEDVEA